MLAAILTLSGTMTVLTSCGNPSNNAGMEEAVAETGEYTINGISDNNGKSVYLFNMNIDPDVSIDSVVVADGKFAFKGTVDKDALLAVGYDLSGWMTIFFNDGTPVTINLNDSTLKGSPINERLTAYDLEVNSDYMALMAKKAAMTPEEWKANEAQFRKDMGEVVDKQIEMVNKIFVEERNTLIPVAFASIYFYGNGIDEYEALQKENVVFANHPVLKLFRDKMEELIKAQEQASAE